MNTIRPFHLAFPIENIEKTKAWYTDVLGCSVGRETTEWIDFNFYGHQISAHLSNDFQGNVSKNLVDDNKVPIRHFGVILEWSTWELLSNRLQAIGVTFVIEPCIRFKGKSGEQGTMFIKDPSGNFLEFKTFKDDKKIFEK